MIYLTQEQLLTIKEEVEKKFNYYLSKYDSQKYSEDIYIQSKIKFKDPCKVTADDITQALLWKYGHINKSNYPDDHKKFIRIIIDNWPDFYKNSTYTLNNMYDFWKERLKGHQNFVTIAYLIHLIKSDEIQIIDQHNFRAFNYLFLLVNPGHSFTNKPNNLLDLKNYNHFFNQLLDILDLSKGKERDLDKFLMMYGKYNLKERNNNG